MNPHDGGRGERVGVAERKYFNIAIISRTNAMEEDSNLTVESNGTSLCSVFFIHAEHVVHSAWILF